MQEIRKFIQGFESFQSQYICVEDSPFTELNKGQKPTTMVVACCDSRTNPTLVMGCEPGEIFVVRNIANIVPPYEPDQGHHGVSSAIEYAVKALGVRNIIILGHSSCGGIRALLGERPCLPGRVHRPLALGPEARARRGHGAVQQGGHPGLHRLRDGCGHPLGQEPEDLPLGGRGRRGPKSGPARLVLRHDHGQASLLPPRDRRIRAPVPALSLQGGTEGRKRAEWPGCSSSPV